MDCNYHRATAPVVDAMLDPSLRVELADEQRHLLDLMEVYQAIELGTPEQLRQIRDFAIQIGVEQPDEDEA